VIILTDDGITKLCKLEHAKKPLQKREVLRVPQTIVSLSFEYPEKNIFFNLFDEFRNGK
jgi:hypothetical protein